MSDIMDGVEPFARHGGMPLYSPLQIAAAVAPLQARIAELWTDLTQLRELHYDKFLPANTALIAERDQLRQQLAVAQAVSVELHCRDLTDADMDTVSALMGQYERDEIGFHALCDKIIASFATPRAEKPEPAAQPARRQCNCGRRETTCACP